MDSRIRTSSVFGPIAWCGLLSGLCAATVVHAQAPTRAEVLASSCTSCHGPGGQGSLRIPGLRTLDMEEIFEIMLGFQNGEERETVMTRVALAFSNEELELISEFLDNVE